MSGFTTYGAAAIAAGTGLPQTLWIKLHTGDPGADATANAAAEDRRISASLEAGTTSNVATNDADLDWIATPVDEFVTYWSGWDAATVGNPWVVGTVSPTISLTNGGNAEIVAGRLRVSFPVHGS